MSTSEELSTILAELTSLFTTRGLMTDTIKNKFDSLSASAKDCDADGMSSLRDDLDGFLREQFDESHPVHSDIDFLFISLYEHGGVLHKQECEGGCDHDGRLTLLYAFVKLKYIIKRYDRLTTEIERNLDDLESSARYAGPENLPHVWSRLSSYVFRMFPFTDPIYEDINSVFLHADIAIKAA